MGSADKVIVFETWLPPPLGLRDDRFWPRGGLVIIVDAVGDRHEVFAGRAPFIWQAGDVLYLTKHVRKDNTVWWTFWEDDNEWAT